MQSRESRACNIPKTLTTGENVKTTRNKTNTIPGFVPRRDVSRSDLTDPHLVFIHQYTRSEFMKRDAILRKQHVSLRSDNIASTGLA